MNKYPIEIFWSDEDEGYIAIAHDLPGCNAWGHTEQEALIELHDAMAAWFIACDKSGEPRPEPSKPFYAMTA
ncbi:type II toxin-antitoxin system HicB family antitoxin [Methylovulum psychrotolerans]|uniref:type II toxin-antitoxin system HicB family antitoxin n=1 Tax=Methylovulum psychrotolerans TaxID=1704499 RepID=UPI001BFEFFF3|nr:type II toxin-antitoxin system HicB family antitoxin [Methylovulum psychrotolerans]MBT9099066.1 type II toxin-antitoxin system HicB family antitoxin [Methylovulum psychrotolerans]